MRPRRHVAESDLNRGVEGDAVSPWAGERRSRGPFTESKELIAGFMLLTFADKAEAVSFALRYADVVGTPEVDVREVP